MTTATLDLDAARRERAHPDGITVRFAGNDLLLPAELPVDVFDPLLDQSEFDLVGVVVAVMSNKDEDDDESFADLLVKLLSEQPRFIEKGLAAVKGSLSLLFGAEQYATFLAGRPSLSDYTALVKGLVDLYGVSLGEAFASPDSSESDGATPKPTSEPATDSTPESSGEAPEPAAAS